MEGYETTIGHVHLKVRDLDSSVAFYRKVLGLQVTERVGSAFALAYRRLVDSGVPVEAVDHGISWALYFQDLDGNGVEIYLDRREEPSGSAEWRGKSRRLSPREFATGQ